MVDAASTAAWTYRDTLKRLGADLDMLMLWIGAKSENQAIAREGNFTLNVRLQQLLVIARTVRLLTTTEASLYSSVEKRALPSSHQENHASNDYARSMTLLRDRLHDLDDWFYEANGASQEILRQSGNIALQAQLLQLLTILRVTKNDFTKQTNKTL